VIFKIPKANFSSFEKELREIHPYEVPEIVAFDPAAVCHAYADWIVSSCAAGE
jgi:periplasmic divalent cation tolerance protein